MCERRVDLLVCSLPLHRHSCIGFILAFASSIHNKQFLHSSRECGRTGAVGPGPPHPHDRFGSSSNPDLNGKLQWSNDVDKSLNETAGDKIRKYRTDCKNNPDTISFTPAIPSTSGRLHSEFIRILFSQSHRETDRFFATSGVQSV